MTLEASPAFYFPFSIMFLFIYFERLNGSWSNFTGLLSPRYDLNFLSKQIYQKRVQIFNELQ